MRYVRAELWGTQRRADVVHFKDRTPPEEIFAKKPWGANEMCGLSREFLRDGSRGPQGRPGLVGGLFVLGSQPAFEVRRLASVRILDFLLGELVPRLVVAVEGGTLVLG